MCGIVAVIGSANKNAADFLEESMYTGVLRGHDSTGIYQVRGNGDVSVHKLPVPGGIFAETRGAKNIIADVVSSRVSVLHHRAATKGSINLDACHPFQHTINGEHIVGVHNGTIRNHAYHYKGKTFDVDSDWCMYKLLEEGDASYKEFDGAFAFLYYTSTDNKIHLAANGQRAISFGIVKSQNLVLVASEAEMLYWLAKRNNLELEDIIIPDDHTDTTFDLNGNVRKFEIKDIPKYEAKVYNGASSFPKTQAQSATRTTAGNGFKEEGTTAVTTTSPTDKRTTLGRIGLRHDQEVEFLPYSKHAVEGNTIRGRIAYIDDNNVPQTAPAFLPMAPHYLLGHAHEGNIDSLLAKVGYALTERAADTKERVSVALNTPSFVCLISDSTGAESERTTPANGALIIRGRKGESITVDQWNELVKDGCINCAGSLSLNDAVNNNYTFVNNNQDICCSDCIKALAA